jgi:hypothetical protein
MCNHEGVAIDTGKLPVGLTAIRTSMERIDIGDLETAVFAQKRARNIAKHAPCGPEKFF